MTFYPVKNKILENLKNGKVSIGMELYTGSASLVEILGYTGFVSAKYCYATHELRLHQNDRCKRFTLV